MKISISSKSGYYVKDSGKTEMYTDTMKYSKYVSNIQTILSKHPITKLCSIVLESMDIYGAVTYKIDGKSVDAGTYQLKEEQKLEISYEITDGNHVVDREGLSWFKSQTKETVEISITPSLDGGKITRDMYIKVKSK